MLITHSFLGTTIGPYRCLFFLLFEDYIEAQSGFVARLDPDIERFARKLGSVGAVVKPFTGDIEATRRQVLDKPWSRQEMPEIVKTPSLLMINQDFDAFDPRKHPWLQINLGDQLRDGFLGEREFRDMLGALADAVVEPGRNIFKAARDAVDSIKPSDAVKVFEAKPGIFGFSIDLVKAAEFVPLLRRKLLGG